MRPLLLWLISLSFFAHAAEREASPKGDAPPLQMRGLGVNTHFGQGWDPATRMPLARALGAMDIRDEISWEVVETTKGQYAIPERSEAWLNTMKRQGLRLILVLDYGNKLYANNLDPDAFAAYCGWMAKHFAGSGLITAYEIWNEPNNFRVAKQYGGLWNGRDAAWIEKFAELVEKAAAAIRAAEREASPKGDPQTPIITGCGVPPASMYLLNRFPKSLAQVDGLTEHPYTYRTPPETIPWGGAENLKRDGISVADDDRSLLSLLRVQGDATEKVLGRRLPLWITESGFSTIHDQKKPGLNRGFSERAQAAYHLRGALLALAHGVKTWCLYDLVDDGNDPYEVEHRFGVLRRDLTPKPAFTAVQRLARVFGGTWQPATGTTLDVPIVELKRIDPWAGDYSEPGPTIKGPLLVQATVAGGGAAMVWWAGHYQAEFAPPLGTLTVPGAISQVAAIDLVSGDPVPVKVTTENGATRIAELPVGSDPVAVTWKESGK